MHIKEIMSTEVAVVDRNDPLSKVEELMVAKKLRHLPVVEDGVVIALVTQRDLFKAAMSSALGYGKKAEKAFLQSVPAKEIMVEPVITVAPETPVAEAIDLMLQKEIGCLPVIDGAKLGSSPKPICCATCGARAYEHAPDLLIWIKQGTAG